jgi:cation-transporting ATPase 13A3/4/5
MSKVKNYCLAVSSDVFRWTVDFAPPTVLQRMLVRGRVFARMSPDEKHELVEKFQSIGYCCGFCGDGANDCGALKAADVGISLSETEASVAAPFTSRVFNISCVPEVIREGRAALVTSFSCFRYMSLYSAIQFTTISFLYASATTLGNFQFLFIDIVLILPIAVFMSYSAPYPVLSRNRPSANLMSRKVLVPLLGHMAICIGIQAVAFIVVRMQPWFIPPVLKHHSSNVHNSESTALFLVSCFEYIFAGVVLNAGPPFREPASNNWYLIATVCIGLLICTHMVLGPVGWLKHLMELTSISTGFSLALLGLGALYFALAWICETVVFKRLSQLVGHAAERITGQSKQRKKYKLIAEQMRV